MQVLESTWVKLVVDDWFSRYQLIFEGQLYRKHIFSKELDTVCGKGRGFMNENGVLTLTDKEWGLAKKRNDVIAPLAQLDVVGQAAAKEASDLLGVTISYVYKLIKRYRMGSGLVTDLARSSRPGGRGKARVPPEIEIIIADVLNTLYLTRQRRSRAVVTREIRKRCLAAGLRPPSYNTIDSRIALLDPVLVTRKRQGGTAARELRSAAGEPPESLGPLEVVQIDHTKMDVIVVDETVRQPIGRPSLTLAIDTFTRCIVGMLVTLEAPSATSVGLCLAHIVTDKSAWLERLGLDIGLWPMHGKPKKIHLDNAPEFHSEALKRGCEQHGIERDYRPKKQPHFGGIIERVIGTAMAKVHELPGTTFSNPQERGTYKSEARASLTVAELEKWLVLAIGTYHGSIHSSLFETPAAVWTRSTQTWEVGQIADKQAFLVDFLPVVRRRVTRVGFVIDHVSYYADSLKSWIAQRDRLQKFIIRCDPRDLSRIWVLAPENNLYFEVPYRSISNPAVTKWEQRQAIENLRKRGREQVNEATIFSMIDQMRELSEKAANDSKRARRDKSRRSHLASKSQEIELVVPKDHTGERNRVKAFEVEEWSDLTHSDKSHLSEGKSMVKEKVVPFEVEEW